MLEDLYIRLSIRNNSYRKQEDLRPGDLRVILPRFSGENFIKNVQLGDNFKALGIKYNATGAQIILAWILAEHPDGV